jgi:hypothetical protein
VPGAEVIAAAIIVVVARSYAVAATLMVIGLVRFGGALTRFIARARQAWIYFWLELPYSKLPAVTLHSVSINFTIKYPMMMLGTLTSWVHSPLPSVIKRRAS